MKAKRYKISISDGILEMTHGLSRTIDEISVGDVFINSEGVWPSYEDRMHGATDIKEIEFDEILYNSLNGFVKMRECLNKEIKRILSCKGDIKFSKDTPISCWDDFEKKYLPKSRKERLEKEETPEQTGERLAKETMEKIKEDLHKHKRARRKK